MSLEAYPLSWPVGRPRTPSSKRDRARFGTSIARSSDNGHTWRQKGEITNYGALTRLREQLALLHATDVVISTNIPTRQDGLPYSKAREPDDTGVAIYFRLQGEAHCLACDRWDRVAGNLAAIAAHVDAIRGQARWGVGDLAQAFAGYRALTAVGARKPWWEALGCSQPPSDFEAAYQIWRAKMNEHHPDRGGNSDQAAEINAAWSEAKRYYVGDGAR